MTTSAQRFYIRSPDGRMIVGFDDLNAARAVALDYGEGAHLVDTNAQAYHPIAQEASDGELVYVQIGGWGAGKFSFERNLIESIKIRSCGHRPRLSCQGGGPKHEGRQRGTRYALGRGPR